MDVFFDIMERAFDKHSVFVLAKCMRITNEIHKRSPEKTLNECSYIAHTELATYFEKSPEKYHSDILKLAVFGIEKLPDEFLKWCDYIETSHYVFTGEH